MPDDGSTLDLLRRAVVLAANVAYDLVAAVVPVGKGAGGTVGEDGDSAGVRSAAGGRTPESQKNASKQGAPGLGLRKGAPLKRRRDGTGFGPSALVGRARTFSAQLFANRRLFSQYGRSVGPPGKRKTLVLDLDETLIHSTSRGSRNHDHVIEVLVDKHVCLYYIYKRPFVDLFLRRVSEWYNVVIFTASMPEYADPVIDYLDAGRTLISHRYFRQSCTQHNGTYIKDLAVIEPDLSSVCLIDNSPISYAINQDNGIPIEGWISDPLDESLLDLLPFLDALRFVDDVRSVLSLRV